MSRKHSRAKRGARAPSPLDGNVAEALRHHQAGRLAEAERGYRGVLAIDPFHVNALHSLGIVASQHGDNAEALRHFRQALALKPDFEAAARNIAHALLMLGRPEEAVNASADALAIGETPEAKLLFVQALSLSQDAARIAPHEP